MLTRDQMKAIVKALKPTEYRPIFFVTRPVDSTGDICFESCEYDPIKNMVTTSYGDSYKPVSFEDAFVEIGGY